MISCLDDPQKHHAAIFEKYSDKRFKRASYFVQTEMSKGFTLPATRRPSTVGQSEHSHELRTMK